MRRLSKVVNIVPVIAKADTLTLEERDFFKKKVASCVSDVFHSKFICLIHIIIPEASLCPSVHIFGSVAGDKLLFTL